MTTLKNHLPFITSCVQFDLDIAHSSASPLPTTHHQQFDLAPTQSECKESDDNSGNTSDETSTISSLFLLSSLEQDHKKKKKKMPHPQGKPSHLGWGGYNLAKKMVFLNWSDHDFILLKVSKSMYDMQEHPDIPASRNMFGPGQKMIWIHHNPSNTRTLQW